MRLDLPTFDLPANAISGMAAAGYWSGAVALVSNVAEVIFNFCNFR
jgi:hypothetical protein